MVFFLGKGFCAAICCSVLQYDAVCCSVTHCVAAVYFSEFEFVEADVTRSSRAARNCVAVCCSVLQYVAVYCSVAHCVAAVCSSAF